MTVEALTSNSQSGDTPPETTISQSPPNAITNIPHLRNLNFTGRESILDEIERKLRPEHGVTKVVALTGLGGVGKSQLAVEYAYRNLRRFSLIWWIRSDEGNKAAEDLAALSHSLVVDETTLSRIRDYADAVRGELETRSDWLLIFDNAESPQVINPYLPKRGGGSVLVTSLDPNWLDIGDVISVPTWTPEEAVEFLSRRTGREDVDAHALAKDLGHLPLALAQAAAFITATGTSYSQYVTLYRTRRAELASSESKLLRNRKTVSATWLISIQRVSADAAEAVELLGFLAAIGSGSIKRWRSQASMLNRRLSKILSDDLQLSYALGALRRYSLIDVNEDSFTIHPLVRDVVRDHIRKRESRRFVLASALLTTAATLACVIAIQFKCADIVILAFQKWHANREVRTHIRGGQAAVSQPSSSSIGGLSKDASPSMKENNAPSARIQDSHAISRRMTPRQRASLDFSIDDKQRLEAWSVMELVGKADFSVTRDPAGNVLRLRSANTSFSLVHLVEAAPASHMYIQWEWKADKLPMRVSNRKKATGIGEHGEHLTAAPIQLIVAFLGFQKVVLLHYTWDSLSPPGSSWRAVAGVEVDEFWLAQDDAKTGSPLAGSSKISYEHPCLVVTSGGSIGNWQRIVRNLALDYRLFYPGEDAPRILGIGITAKTNIPYEDHSADVSIRNIRLREE